MLKRFIIIFTISLYSFLAHSKQIRVLIVDTGVSISHAEFRPFINMKDWESDAYFDLSGHGTHVAGIILDHVCPQVELISCKFYNPLDDTKEHNMNRGIACFKRALKEHIDIVNYSAGGQESSDEEFQVLKQISDKGIKIVVAAGNAGKDLSTDDYNYYPAKYNLKNIIVVGNLEKNGKRNLTSNYGLEEMVWEVGTKVWSTLPANSWGFMTGTSQSTAVHTNKLIRKMCQESK
jgi:subtilisin family serine protease